MSNESTMRRRRRAGQALVGLGLLLGGVGVRAEVHYPAAFNVTPAEGTVEFWIRPPTAPSSITPFHLRGADGGMHFRLAVQRVEGALRAVTQIRFEPREKMLPVGAAGGPGTPADTDDDGWIHLAFAWRENEISELYINGERRSQRNHSFTFANLLGDLAGTDRGGQSALYFSSQNERGWVIDEFRLSSVARTPAELGWHQGPLQPDIHTVILDGFEQIVMNDGARHTQPSVLLDGRGGRLSDTAEPVPGKFGQGLRLR